MTEGGTDPKRGAARRSVEDFQKFDYGAPAELFPSRIKKGRSRVTYKRFDTAAEAIRFAMEEVPPPALLGVYLEIDEVRYGLREIQDLYERAEYPLRRRATEPDEAAGAAS